MLNGQTALLVVDFQIDFLDLRGRYPVAQHQTEPMLAVANQLIAAASSCGAPLVYIGNEYNHSDPLNLFRNRAALKGNAGTRLDPRLSVVSEHHYFPKNKPSAFTNAQLDIFLREQAVKQILLIGVYASACIRGTALDGLKHGYQVCVLRDVVADASDRRRDKALTDLAHKGVTVLSSSQSLL